MEGMKSYDILSLGEDKEIQKIINNEKLYYSDFITKKNCFGMNQERVLLLTDKSIYNLKKKTFKKKLPYNELIGITTSKLTYEFVLHGNNEDNDYSYNSQDKNLVLSLIAKFYHKFTNKTLKICEVEEKKLNKYITTKKEKKREGFTRMNEDFLINTEKFIEENAKDSEAQKDDNRPKKTGIIFSNHDSIKSVTLEDFQVIKVIGRGSYGKVCLVQYKPTKDLYAMKSLKKDVLLDEDQVESTLLEKKILQSLDYPFLVGMVFCFQTEERIYFVMPFVRGGELFQHLRKNKYFPEKKVKFYAASIGLALEYLHTHGIVYRDIKPENVLLDEDGYLKLIDFGMAKMLEGNDKTNSFCGTPEYLAPEIITGEGHNMAADWWSYGTLIYEMLFGIPPFFCENVEKMYDLITHSELRFPKKIIVSEEAKDLLSKLLIKNQDMRLGSKEGFKQIQEHPFFRGFDWQSLEGKKMEAPFKPELSDPLDVGNFDVEFTSEALVSSEIAEKNLKLIHDNQDQFEDFDD